MKQADCVTSLRTALVGAGLMGYWHGHAIQRIGGQVVAIVDSNMTSAQTLVKHHPQAQVFGSLKTALDNYSIDVVHICTPSNSHAELIEMALKSGCHVLAEKPLASSLQETESLIDLANKLGLKLNPVHQFAFQRGFLKILEQRQQLGSIVRFAYTTCSAGGANKDAAMRRSILLEILPHPVALLDRLFEDAFDPNLLQVLQFTDEDLELTGVCQNTRISICMSLRGRPTCNELRIVGTDSTAYIDLFHGYGFFEMGQVSRRAKIIKPIQFGADLCFKSSKNLIHRLFRAEFAYPGLRELIERFYQAIAKNTPPPISNTEILAVVHLIDSCKKNI